MADAKMLSVIVPVYNVEIKYLKECFESILDQTFRDYELIIVDDGAPEDIRSYIDSYDFRGADVKVIHRENGGVAVARNDGLDICTGRYVTFIDSDDTVEKDCFEEITKFADRNALQVLMFGINRDFGTKSIPFSPYLCDIEHFTCAQKEEVMFKCLVGILPFYVCPPASADAAGSACAKLYERKFLEESRLRYTKGLKRAEDMEFNLRVFDAASDIGYLYRFFYHYRQLETSATYEYREGGIEVFTASLNAINKFLVASGKPEKYLQIYYMRCMFFYLESMDMDYLNPNNPKSLKKRLSELREKSFEEPYSEAFEKLTGEYLTVARKIPLFLIRHRMFGLLALFYRSYRMFRK